MPAAKSYEVIWGFTERDRNGNPTQYHVGDPYPGGAKADEYLTKGDVNHGPLIREKATAPTDSPKEK
jgi:hypothetical protein